jgi:Tfp pilus assembly protein PilF
MMADKKVERSVRGRPLTPTQKMEAALSDPGTLNRSDPSRDKGKSALADKFREREERWRREQALHDQQAAQAADHADSEPAEQGGPEPAEPEERGEGGGS